MVYHVEMKYLGIDFGLRRIGLATSEGELASPLKVIEVKGFKNGVEKISEFIRQEGFSQIIVGLPEGKIGQTILGFVNALKNLGFNVTTFDETLSTKQAIALKLKSNTPKKKRRFNDATAAAIILQNYLDSRPRPYEKNT